MRDTRLRDQLKQLPPSVESVWISDGEVIEPGSEEDWKPAPQIALSSAPSSHVATSDEVEGPQSSHQPDPVPQRRQLPRRSSAPAAGALAEKSCKGQGRDAMPLPVLAS